MILLDTHALIWFAEGIESLGHGSRKRIAAAFADGEAAVSAISFWEVAMLVRKQRVQLTEPARQWVRKLRAASQIHVTDVSWEIAVAGGDLPDELHGDPIDRIIIATARHQDWPLVTADRAILAYAEEGHLHVLDARI